MKRLWMTAAGIVLAMGLTGIVTGTATRAQTPAQAQEQVGREVEPIRCWWLTTTAAVRIGETFSVVLTCAVLENESMTVVPDQSRLEPSVLQIPPFEVIGGTHPPDRKTPDRRFFQYQYTLRLIQDDLFAKDVAIPRLSISYRVQSRLQDSTSIQGREQAYVMPPQMVRVLALVPAEAADIRDVRAESFGNLDERRFRANVLRVVGGVLFGLAGLLALQTLLVVARRYRDQSPTAKRLVSNRIVLGEVGRELSRIRRQRQQESWNEEMAGRALAAFRIAGGELLSEPFSQTAAGPERSWHDGQLQLRGGWLRGTKVLVSSSATADAIARELTRIDLPEGRRRRLQDVHTALTRFTAVRYGRDSDFDETSLDESLTDGIGLVRHLKLEDIWILRRFRAATQSATEMRSRVWSR